tara:strand:- start:92 stop:772 length:681 start_codon:yes stop_codon:yes gene_type:complete
MILFDGGSWLYGDELEDREKYRFSKILSERVNREHVNISEPGKSNNAILRTTIEYCENNLVDIAIIQFTGTSRTEIRAPNEDRYISLSIGNVLKNGHSKELSEKYYQYIHNDNEEIANFHKNKFLLEYYFKTKNIPYFFVSTDQTYYKFRTSGVIESSWYHMMNKEPVKSLVNLLGDSNRNEKYYCQGRYKKSDKRSLGHPNKLGHKVIAEYIYENFLNKYASGKI